MHVIPQLKLTTRQAFTPLVSPAVTPYDARFQIPDFTVPGAYFSPLTSPALNAQSQQHHQSQATTSGSPTGHSTINVDMEILGEPAMQQESGRSLRSTNKRNAPRSANANGRVRQSPIVKPRRRRAIASSLLSPCALEAKGMDIVDILLDQWTNLPVA
jgi:hypothetical protein